MRTATDDSAECRSALGGVWGSATDEARDGVGLGGTDATDDARVPDARRGGSGGVGGTSDQPKREMRTAVSEGWDTGGGGEEDEASGWSSSILVGLSVCCA